MTKKIVSATAVLIGAGSLLMGCSSEQASAGCITQDSPSWYAVYSLQEGSAAAEAGGGKTDAECAGSSATQLKGETLGVFKFSDPHNASDVKLVLRPNGLASRAGRDPGDPYLQNAVGKMGTTPDAQSFCSAAEFNQSQVNDPGREASGTSGAIPATVIKYQYEQVSVYADPGAPGTQLKGALTYTRDGCTAKYSFKAVWPAVGCVPGSTKPAESCGEGSGANPDFALTCDAELEVCVPSKDIPSLK